MSELLALDGPPALSRFRLKKVTERLAEPAELYAQFVHLLDLDAPLADEEHSRARALLDYGPRQGLPVRSGMLVATVVPRLGTISPWSSKASDIFAICELDSVRRVERGVRWYADRDLCDTELAMLFDRMTERLVAEDELGTVFQELEPRPLTRVPLLRGGGAALSAANVEMGLALSTDEIEYLVGAYLDLERDPTDVELMMFAQANSEHCRHKIFNASWRIDGEAQEATLFDMIRNTHRQINGAGILSAYADNAAVIEGFHNDRFLVDDDKRVYGFEAEDVHVLMKVETHNHPTGIAPYPGAATGSGGEIRDEGAVGRGSKPKAGLTGFTTSHLNLPDFGQPWEVHTGKPDRMVSALEIMLEGPIGGAAFNNEYGRPALTGYFRTFEQADDGHSGRVWGYHKPIMIAGGVGNVRAEHVHAQDFPPGTHLVVLGGPAMLIGLGGGAASSMASGVSTSDLDFASVQRDNPEMERRCQEVIDRCIALGAGNPILLIHDVGAGGLSNALPELVKDAGAGGHFELRKVPNADPGMAPHEIWCNEAQERYVLGIAPGALERFERICSRERCPYAVVGHSTAEKSLLVTDEAFEDVPVDLPLSVLFGKPPRMERSFERRRVARAALDFDIDIAEAVGRVLRFPAVASKRFLITIGDRSITGLVGREQMVGPWQLPVSDVAVTLGGFTTYQGEAFAMGERSPLALIDAAASARMAVGEALTNLYASDVNDLARVVLSANWMAAAGENAEEQALFDAVHAVGMELCPALGIAIPVGKDSLSMRTAWTDEAGVEREVSSPMTLIVSAFALIEDARLTLTPVLRRVPSRLLLVDLGGGRNRLGGSALAQVCGQLGDVCPNVDDARLLASALNAVQALRRDGRLLAYHDRSDGGLLATLAEMAFAGRVGWRINIEEEDLLAALFAEELGVVVQVAEDDVDTVISALEGVRCVDLGWVGNDETLEVAHRGEVAFRATRAELERCWAETSFRMQSLRDNPQCAEQEFASITADDPGFTAQIGFDVNDDLGILIGRERPRVAVLREQGVNGQVEMAAAFDRAGFEAVDVHMSDLLSGEVQLADFPALAACGGFSYGDVLGGGGGWAKSVLFHPRLRDAMQRYFEDDRLVLGICNGCQMLAQLKDLIPGASYWPRFVRNASEQFEGRNVLVQVNASPSPWLTGMSGSVIPAPVAHGEGRAEFAGHAHLSTLDAAGDVVLQYVDNHHAPTMRYPANPNGAPEGLAGVTAAEGRVLAMMPHPERAFRSCTNGWADESWGEDGPWMRLFRNARAALAC